MRGIFIFLILLLITPVGLALQKNVASQKWTIFAFDRTDNTAKTGDLGQITGSIWIDGVENVIGDTNPTELAHGYYEFDIDQAETNGDYLVMDAVSSTGNIQVVGCPMGIWTTAPYFSVLSIDSNGRLDIIKVAGTTQTANDMSGDIDTVVTAVGNSATAAKLLAYVQLLARSDAAIKSDNSTELGEINADEGSGAGDFDSAMDSQEMLSVMTDDLESRLTSTRAGYLNNLSGGAVALASGVTVTAVAADAIEAGDFKTGAIDADALATDFVTEIWSKAMVDIAAGDPSATASVLTAINYLYEGWRNKYVTNTTGGTIEGRLYKDDGVTILVESDHTDDGTDFTREELRAED